MKWFVLWLLLPAWPAAGQPAIGPDRAGAAAAEWPVQLQVPFVLLNNLPVVQTTVNGRTGNFVLDTGAETTLLNQHYFAGVPVTAPTGAGATGGLTHAASYRVSSFAWQELRLRDVAFTTTDLSHLGATPLLGLLGADLLTHYAVTLDYTHRLASLQTAAAPPPRLTLPFTRQDYGRRVADRPDGAGRGCVRGPGNRPAGPATVPRPATTAQPSNTNWWCIPSFAPEMLTWSPLTGSGLGQDAD